MIDQIIDLIESHLDENMDLHTITGDFNYSKYYLHRMFTAAAGIPLHEYAVRRRLTEAARTLVSSDVPVIEAAARYGYGTQQLFAAAFRDMYKMTPGECRKRRIFYPLQHRISSRWLSEDTGIYHEKVRYAVKEDIDDWMEVVGSSVDGYPYLNEKDYICRLRNYIAKRHGIVLEKDGVIAGVMAFSVRSSETVHIEYLAVLPQNRKAGLYKILVSKLAEELFPGREISITTYRENDRADTGYRKYAGKNGRTLELHVLWRHASWNGCLWAYGRQVPYTGDYDRCGDCSHMLRSGADTGMKE